MKEFISILIRFVFMGIAESIDSAFNNAISIDAIVVCGSLFSIDLILKSLGEMGTYTYRTARKDETAYLTVNVVSKFCVGNNSIFRKKLHSKYFWLNSYTKGIIN